ncbi:hypothetical protein Vadar_026703 [Vaccinium darrowii]|uniref:Uncharacterized protein n=1 Tax=Vaccinium darrowii TaxID=229202 RepID=A0ACB7X3Z2_9ERIC|nr:hypothetical protein Vadar_026703 [Vaccinium darrowii]
MPSSLFRLLFTAITLVPLSPPSSRPFSATPAMDNHCSSGKPFRSMPPRLDAGVSIEAAEIGGLFAAISARHCEKEKRSYYVIDLGDEVEGNWRVLLQDKLDLLRNFTYEIGDFDSESAHQTKGVMENPSSRTNGKGVKMESYESDLESEFSPRNAYMERVGLQSMADDDSLRRFTEGEILQMKFGSEEEAHLSTMHMARQRGLAFGNVKYDRGLDRMRVVDAEAETATKHSTPVLITQLHSLEKHGSEVYTHNIFKLFQDEILRESALVVANRVDEGQDRRLYYLEHYSRRECKWTVEYNPFDSRIKCCCLMFESFDLPCCHMISVMKYEHLVAIPHNLIMQRWTRFARLDSPTFQQIPHNMTSMARELVMQTRQSNRVDASKDVAGPSHKTNTRKRKKALVLEDIKMPKEQLGSYATRSVICERIVAVRELTKYKIPKIVVASGLEPICKIQGNGNVSLVREFFMGIDATTVDTKNESFVIVVRGTRIEVTPDALAKFGKFN